MRTIARTPPWKDKIAEGQNISEEKVMNIYEEYTNTDKTQMEVAYKFDTSQGTVSNIVTGRHHSDVTGVGMDDEES